ncbi:Thermitase, partial [Symbiodinium sp. KB8]
AVAPAVADPSSTRPTCTDSNDGDCGRIVMESTADGWTISRTGRYNNNEYASIELQ